MSRMSLLSPLASGFLLSAALIVAIGAQNAFVLRQGLAREHVGAVALFCAGADALLMSAGVLGMGQAIAAVPALAQAMALLGALFLLAYGARALRRALRPGTLRAAGGAPRSRAAGAGAGRGLHLAQPACLAGHRAAGG